LDGPVRVSDGADRFVEHVEGSEHGLFGFLVEFGEVNGFWGVLVTHAVFLSLSCTWAVQKAADLLRARRAAFS
jgi:hypothetical protein